MMNDDPACIFLKKEFCMMMRVTVARSDVAYYLLQTSFSYSFHSFELAVYLCVKQTVSFLSAASQALVHCHVAALPKAPLCSLTS